MTRTERINILTAASKPGHLWKTATGVILRKQERSQPARCDRSVRELVTEGLIVRQMDGRYELTVAGREWLDSTREDTNA